MIITKKFHLIYKLTKDADRDLVEAYLYGYQQFGEKQAEEYFSELKNCH